MFGGNGVENRASKYLFILVKDVSGYTWSKPTAVCTAVVTTDTLVRWCVATGLFNYVVRDTARHFKNRAMAERMIREIVHALKAQLKERGAR